MEITQICHLHEIGSKKNQEDYLWPAPPAATPDDRIFIVCDGVGGSACGEVASRIVAETVGAGLRKLAPAEIGLEQVDALLEKARVRLVEYAKEHGEVPEMATTFTLLFLVGDKAFISWLGDSRVYHLGQSEVLFRTEDHSLVNSLVKTGQLTAEEAQAHPQKNLLLKAVRANEALPHAEGHWVKDIRDGDHFLLCTDGLLENVTEPDFFQIIDGEQTVERIEQGFKQLCFDKTKDNYSMYLVRVRINVANKKKSPGRRRRRRMVIGLSVLLLLLLLSAGVFYVTSAHIHKQTKLEEMVPVAAGSITAETDSTRENADSAAAAKDSVSAAKDSLPIAKVSASATKDSASKNHPDSSRPIH